MDFWRRSDGKFSVEFVECLHSWSDDEWDEWMKRDLASGNLDKMLAQVDADIAESCDVASFGGPFHGEMPRT